MHEKKLMNKQLNKEKRQNFHDAFMPHVHVHVCLQQLCTVYNSFPVVYLMLVLCHMMGSCYHKSN